MPRLLVAPDKFRGTASATAVASAAARGGERAGWQADAVPMSDGGEGLLEALGADLRTTIVTGPLGAKVAAQWGILASTRDTRPLTAVIEMSQASGLSLAGGAARNRPLDATTTGTGELVLAAVDAGAERVIVGCGGSATTDGGLGAVSAIGSPERLRGAELIIASDVTTLFEDAARVFAPQKGATALDVEVLGQRLSEVAAWYLSDLAVDVRSAPGAGAAGGLAGGLLALGGRIVAGFSLVAEHTSLEARAVEADLVMTGEGRLDDQSFEGKVVGGVCEIALRHGVPVLCVVGDCAASHLPRGVRVHSLLEEVGKERAWNDTEAAIEETTFRALG